MVERHNISEAYRWNARDSELISTLLPYEGTPFALERFVEIADDFSDYGYWYTLGTLWVSYTGWTDLRTWRELFASRRPDRAKCLMKPDELRAWRRLPKRVTAFRAHRPGERDWLSLTLDEAKAEAWARHRDGWVGKYQVPREAILCLFLRREESEILVLDRRNLTKKKRRGSVTPAPPVADPQPEKLIAAYTEEEFAELLLRVAIGGDGVIRDEVRRRMSPLQGSGNGGGETQGSRPGLSAAAPLGLDGGAG